MIAAARVIGLEAKALKKLEKNLPSDLALIVEKIIDLHGRVIVSGVGKSGHVGCKIAATLASTGTPSSFIHPTEASHGDLGMITSQDLCLLISNSGETTELRDIVNHTRRFGIPLAAISSNPKSTLMKTADYKLTLISAPEACPIGLAPTTSTTLTLALGDALAVALMERRRFGAADFKMFHPGGKLGAQLASVSQLMHTGEAIPIVQETTSMQDTLIEMTSKGFGIAAVTRSGSLIGVITDGDLRRHMDNLMNATAGKVASLNPITIRSEMLAAEALRIMNANKISAMFSIDDARNPIGILHIHDLLRSGVA